MATNACGHTGFSLDCSKHQVQQCSERILVHVGSPHNQPTHPQAQARARGESWIPSSQSNSCLSRETPGALILHRAKSPQASQALLLLAWARQASAGMKQGACFLYAVPSVGKVHQGWGWQGNRDKLKLVTT